MPVFALTGNLGCGKTTALMLLKKKGASVLDIDEAIHNYYKDKKNNIYKKISALFPEAVAKRAIDRKKLGQIVFSDKKKLKMLEAIVHPVAIRDLKSWVKDSKQMHKVSIAEVPLLFEKNLEGIFDGTILVYTEKGVLLKRIINKLKLSKAAMRQRLSAFEPFSEKNKKADFIINNSFGMETLKREIDSLWGELEKYEHKCPRI
ncbi:MAG: dephospho-CoA kinase [Candidatus Omnitrophota bacterium]